MAPTAAFTLTPHSVSWTERESGVREERARGRMPAVAKQEVDWLALLEQIQRGDRVALLRVTGLVTGYLTRFAAYEHRSSWDDVCQEVLLKLLKSHREGTLRDRAAFVAYAGRVTRTTLIDWIRKNTKESLPGEETDDSGPSFEEWERGLGHGGDADLALDLRTNLPKLAEPQQRVLAAVYLEGRSYEEASKRLEMPLGTLKRHQTQGLRALRELMGLAGASP